MSLFHKRVFWPNELTKLLPTNREIKLIYSIHAQIAAKSDRYGKINLPETININKESIFEVEILGHSLFKYGIRIPYNSEYDLTLIIERKTNFVRTVWLNEKDDKHYSLKREKYEKWTKK